MRDNEAELSPAESRMYAECMALIKKGPATAEAIGESLWLVREHRLYRIQVASFTRFLSDCTKINLDHGLRVVEDWIRTPRGRSIMAKHRGIKDNDDGPERGARPAIPAPQSRVTPSTRKPASEPSEEAGVEVSPAQDLEIVTMELSELTLDTALQCRASVSPATVAAYSERMRAGDVFPPLDVFEIDGVSLLVDGWQRYPAAKDAGLTTLPVRVHRGTRQDAIRFAIDANSRHGQPLTNRDKRHAVEMVLRASPEDSDHRIAELCKVSHTLVAKVRSQLATVASCGKRTGRDGKARRLPRKASSRQPKPDSAQAKQEGTDSDQGDQPTRHDGGPGEAEAEEGDDRKEARQPEARFSINDARSRLEDYLFAELKRWPEERRWQLGEELHKFADINCARPR